MKHELPQHNTNRENKWRGEREEKHSVWNGECARMNDVYSISRSIVSCQTKKKQIQSASEMSQKCQLANLLAKYQCEYALFEILARQTSDNSLMVQR